MLIASKVWLFSEPIFVWSISLGTVVILSVITQLVLVRPLSGLGSTLTRVEMLEESKLVSRLSAGKERPIEIERVRQTG